MTFGSLFSGIGGIDMGLERAGWECKWQVEIDEFCRKVLTKHWPNVPKYGDITKLNGSELERVDLLAGGFPCQDVSQAGKRAGIEGSRSGLWFEFHRLIAELRPKYVLIENVPGLLNGRFEDVSTSRCVCGRTGGRRGLHQHHGAKALLLPESRYRNECQGEEPFDDDAGNVWGEPSQGQRCGRDAKRVMGLGDHWKTGDEVSANNTAIFGPQGRTVRDLFTSVANGSSIAGSEQRGAYMVNGCQELWEDSSGHDSRTESEGADQGTRDGMVCEGCGRSLPNSPSKSVFRTGIQRVLRDLSGLRMDAGWISLRASDFGASHLRKRVFIVAQLAYTLDGGSQERWSQSTGTLRYARDEDHRPALAESGVLLAHASRQRDNGSGNTGALGGRESTVRRGVREASEPVADTSIGLVSESGWGPQGRDGTGSAGAILADSESEGLSERGRISGAGETQSRSERDCGELADTESGQQRLNSNRDWDAWEGREDSQPGGMPVFALGPSDPRWPDILRERPDLAPALVSPLRGVADGVSDLMERALSNRTKRLSRLGNAVVPDCVEWIGRRILEADELTRAG